MTSGRRRIIGWLLGRLTPAPWRDSIAGDFEETASREGLLRATLAAVAVAVRLRRTQHSALSTPHRAPGTQHSHSAPGTQHPALLSGLSTDFRQATRALLRHRGYTTAVAAVLAVGIGANVAVFSLADRLLFRSVPGVGSERDLVTVTFGTREGASTWFSVPLAVEVASIPAFAQSTAYGQTAVHVAVAGGIPRRLDVQFVDAAFFQLLRSPMTRGRAFTDQEARDPGAAPAVIVSDRFWRDELGESDDAIGRTIVLNGDPWTVAGVAARGFRGPSLDGSVDVWVPIGQSARIWRWYGSTLLTDRDSRVFSAIIGRLAPGRTVNDVETQVDVVRRRFAAEFPKSVMLNRWLFLVRPGLREGWWIEAQLERSALLLGGIVVLLLLLTSANAGTLMLAHAAGRRGELATRLALGASRARLTRLLLVEGLLLAAIAGTLALGVAVAIGRLAAGTILLRGLPPLAPPSLDWRIVTATLAIAVLSALISGLVPALAGRRGDLRAALQAVGRSRASGRGLGARVLMTAQVAISLTLLSAALLLTRSMAMRGAIDPGFDPSQVVELSIDPSTQGYEAGRMQALYRRVADDLRRTPGVRNVAVTVWAPFSRNLSQGRFTAEPPADATVTADLNSISAGYFDTIGARFLAGRDFLPSEVMQTGAITGEAPVVVTASLAKELFGDAPAVGRRITGAPARTSTLMIIGVVADLRHVSITKPPEPTIFEPLHIGRNSRVTLVVGTSLPATEIAGRARAALASIDASLPIYDVRTLADSAAGEVAQERLVTTLAAVFSVLATLLAAVGLYGVLARGVADRRRELSIRVALGATPAMVGRLVASDAFRTGAAGILVGAATTAWLSKYLDSWLFGVTRWDVIAWAAALALVIGILFASALRPAQRAARIDCAAELK